MDIQDQFGKPINTNAIEKPEQDLARAFIKADDTVLELGARYGSVSCVINSKLRNKKNQVVIEPDSRVWDALERNRRVNGGEFQIVKGFLSAKKLGLTNLDVCLGGYGATAVEQADSAIPSFTLDEIKASAGLDFNVLVADCEGFLEQFFNENPTFYDGMRLIIFEADYPEKCNYAKIRTTLASKGFTRLVEGHQNVWVRS
jgi:FkbM family methyltransferase